MTDGRQRRRDAPQVTQAAPNTRPRREARRFGKCQCFHCGALQFGIVVPFIAWTVWCGAFGVQLRKEPADGRGKLGAHSWPFVFQGQFFKVEEYLVVVAFLHSEDLSQGRW